MHFSKPYPIDYRRPKDAEALLENQLDLTFSLLKEKGLRTEDIAIGFIDEASPQSTANTVRVWSFGKVRSIKRVLSLTFAESLSEVKRITGDSWDEFSQRMGYAKSWVERFLKGKQYYMDLGG